MMPRTQGKPNKNGMMPAMEQTSDAIARPLFWGDWTGKPGGIGYV
jgi:hypothetical protein